MARALLLHTLAMVRAGARAHVLLATRTGKRGLTRTHMLTLRIPGAAPVLAARFADKFGAILARPPVITEAAFVSAYIADACERGRHIAAPMLRALIWTQVLLAHGATPSCRAVARSMDASAMEIAVIAACLL